MPEVLTAILFVCLSGIAALGGIVTAVKIYDSVSIRTAATNLLGQYESAITSCMESGRDFHQDETGEHLIFDCEYLGARGYLGEKDGVIRFIPIRSDEESYDNGLFYELVTAREIYCGVNDKKKIESGIEIRQLQVGFEVTLSEKVDGSFSLEDKFFVIPDEELY